MSGLNNIRIRITRFKNKNFKEPTISLSAKNTVTRLNQTEPDPLTQFISMTAGAHADKIIILEHLKNKKNKLRAQSEEAMRGDNYTTMTRLSELRNVVSSVEQAILSGSFDADHNITVFIDKTYLTPQEEKEREEDIYAANRHLLCEDEYAATETYESSADTAILDTFSHICRAKKLGLDTLLAQHGWTVTFIPRLI